MNMVDENTVECNFCESIVHVSEARYNKELDCYACLECLEGDEGVEDNETQPPI